MRKHFQKLQRTKQTSLLPDSNIIESKLLSQKYIISAKDIYNTIFKRLLQMTANSTTK